MFTIGQRTAVANAFALAGYHGQIRIAPVTSEDERIFVLPSETFAALTNVHALAQILQQLLDRKVWIVEQSASWPMTESFR